MNCVKCADSFILNFFERDQSNFNNLCLNSIGISPYQVLSAPKQVHYYQKKQRILTYYQDEHFLDDIIMALNSQFPLLQSFSTYM